MESRKRGNCDFGVFNVDSGSFLTRRETMRKVSVMLVIGVLVFGLGCLGTARAGLIADNGSTNNISDWEDTSNSANYGRWSYWDGGNNTLLGHNYDLDDEDGDGDKSEQDPNSPYSNWCTDPNNGNIVWFVRNNGGVRTDGRAMRWVYTIDSNETGDINVDGTFKGASGGLLAIYRSNDTDSSTPGDKSNWTLIDGPFGVSSEAFHYTISNLQAGEDIIFAVTSTQWWWEYRYLDVTLTPVPEPATIGLMLLGLAGLIRRK